MKNKKGIVIVGLGAVLLLSALFLLLFNERAEEHAGEEAERIIRQIQEIPVLTPNLIPAEENEQLPLTTSMTELPVVCIDGYEYIGYLTLPDLSLTLPIMADWDYDRLKIAPCRQFGSSESDDLVIAAHNYKTHFGRLGQLPKDAEVCFKDMTGKENWYCLIKLETLNAESVDTVQNSGYDLVLYTCTKGGTNRIGAFFERLGPLS